MGRLKIEMIACEMKTGRTDPDRIQRYTEANTKLVPCSSHTVDWAGFIYSRLSRVQNVAGRSHKPGSL